MFLLHDFFKARGIRDKVKMRYHYPVDHVHATANVARWAKPEFDLPVSNTRPCST